jgi:hypothetical protein
MTAANEPQPPFGAPSLEQLTALVFELASQLHVERAQRIALQTALEEAGLLSPSALAAVGAGAAARARSAAALDRAIAGMMRVLTESDDPRRPLRPEGGG